VLNHQCWSSRVREARVANTESQNHSIVGVGTDLCGSSSSNQVLKIIAYFLPSLSLLTDFMPRTAGSVFASSKGPWHSGDVLFHVPV